MLTEQSRCIVRVALHNLITTLGTLKAVGEGDQVSLARGQDEVRVALSEMGFMNRREEVLFEKYFDMWGIK
jgi:hypothetical protein